jgi:starch synthase
MWVHGLARKSLARGHNVSVIMPFYECLPQDQIDGLGFEMEVDVPKGYTWDGVMQVCVRCGGEGCVLALSLEPRIF